MVQNVYLDEIIKTMHSLISDMYLNKCPLAYKTDKVQPCVDVPFDRRCGHADKFSL